MSDDDDALDDDGEPLQNPPEGDGAALWLSRLLTPRAGAEPPAEPGSEAVVRPWTALGLGAPPSWFRPSPGEEALFLVRQAAEKFRQEGDEESAEALLKLIGPKLPRGRQPEWSTRDRFNLALAIREEARANPGLKSLRAVCRAIADRPEWQGHSEDALRKHFERFAKAEGMSSEQAFEALRGLTKLGQ
jgi:hypothetical protein